MVRLVTLSVLAVFGAAAPYLGGSTGASHAVVAPLADPAVVPGIARCTSDGACTVTEEDGTVRAGTPLHLVP